MRLSVFRQPYKFSNIIWANIRGTKSKPGVQRSYSSHFACLCLTTACMLHTHTHRYSVCKLGLRWNGLESPGEIRMYTHCTHTTFASLQFIYFRLVLVVSVSMMSVVVVSTRDTSSLEVEVATHLPTRVRGCKCNFFLFFMVSSLLSHVAIVALRVICGTVTSRLFCILLSLVAAQDVLCRFRLISTRIRGSESMHV